MSKPESIWGPHWYLHPSEINEDIKNDPCFAIANTMIAVAAAPELVALPMHNQETPPNLHIVRGILARLLAKTSNVDRFHQYTQEHGVADRPTELIRTYASKMLAYYASITGLLHATEIEYIERYSYGHAPQYFYKIEKESTSPNHDEVVKAAKLWKSQGYKIGVFQGAFDPVVPAHLANATECFIWAQWHGQKLKLIWIFDNEQLIKRKGVDRPRFKDINKRRQSIEGLWNVSATIETAVDSISNMDAYAREYQELNTDYVFVPFEAGIKFTYRQHSAESAGAKAIMIPYAEGLAHSTDIMKKRHEYVTNYR